MQSIRESSGAKAPTPTVLSYLLGKSRPRMSRIHWIEMPGRFAIMARPRADDWLEVDITEWRTSGVDLVVSLLEREEVSELGLQREAELCRACGIEFVSFPIPDRGVP